MTNWIIGMTDAANVELELESFASNIHYRCTIGIYNVYYRNCFYVIYYDVLHV